MAALLARQAPIEFADIVAQVPAYADVAAKGSRMRMFERDKDELRTLGVPIETVGKDGSEHAAYRLRATGTSPRVSRRVTQTARVVTSHEMSVQSATTG